MKSTIKNLAMVAVLLAAATTVSAQTTADATANILPALGCVNTAGDAGALDWGDIVPGSSATDVVISSDASGTRSISGGGDATLVATDDGNSAEFTLTGLGDAVVDLSLTSGSITLDDGSSNTMDAAISLSSATATLTGGTATFYVGGTLTVGASQVAGAYATTFEVTAEYQ